MRYLALLRGVNNIGAGKRVAMADLRVLFEGLGFTDVSTLGNSGNVVFAAPRGSRAELVSRIREALASRLALTVSLILLSASEVAAAVRGNPLAKAVNPSHLLFLVPPRRSDLSRVRPLLEQRFAPERLALGTRVVYLWCANGVARSPLWAAADRALARTGTVRNMATFTKAMSIMEGNEGRRTAWRRSSTRS